MRNCEIVGRRFGSLTAMKRVGTKPRQGQVWELLCDCGAHVRRLIPQVLYAVAVGRTPACKPCNAKRVLRELNREKRKKVLRAQWQARGGRPAYRRLVMLFYLGAHHPEWLARATVPLCVSVSSLRTRIFVEGRKRRAPIPRALAPWLCDSAGFTEVSTYGKWRGTAKAHAELVVRASKEIGNLACASPRDWMCEPWVIRGGTVIIHGKRVTFPGTGLSVREHQRRTVDSVLELRALAPRVHWIPVLQGWSLGEYLDCAELYDRAGIDLRTEELVGLGSVCRRQDTMGAAMIIRWLADEGLRLHGFGFKVDGLRAAGKYLASADSMAWSSGARYAPPIPGHTHKRCNNCLENALDWRHELLERLGESTT